MSAPKSPNADRPQPGFSAYTAMLILSFCFVTLGCVLLYLELGTYQEGAASLFNGFKIEELEALRSFK